MPTADTRSSIVITKNFTYRGVLRAFTNRYHVDGAEAITLGNFDTLADAVTAAEKLIYPSGVTIVRADWCDASTATSTNPHGDKVWFKTYSIAGTYAHEGNDLQAPGDCCGLMKWSTDQRTSKNHPIYLFNYWHGVFIDDDSLDSVAESQLSAYNVYGNAWVSGFSDGLVTRHRCGPRGAVAQNNFANAMVHHRDLPN